MPRKVSDSDPRPSYVQIASDIRNRIGTGELKAGDKLPPTRELATGYGVAQMTIHHALGTLRSEGLVTTRQGRGSFVSDRRPDSAEPAAMVEELTAEVRDLRQSVRTLEERLERLEQRSH